MPDTSDVIAVCEVHGWYWATVGYGAERCPEPGCGARVDSYVYARSYQPPGESVASRENQAKED